MRRCTQPMIGGFVLLLGLTLSVCATVSQSGLQPQPSPPTLQLWWELLSSENAAEAYRAQMKMVAYPKPTVDFLDRTLEISPPIDTNHISRLVQHLNDPFHRKRVFAQKELKKIGSVARPFIEEALQNNPSAEMQLRASSLLKYMLVYRLSAKEIQNWRSIEVLETIGSSEAKKVLQRLANGPKGRLTTDKAGSALQRLSRVHKPLPKLEKMDYGKRELAKSTTLARQLYVICFSPKGKMLAVAGQGGAVVIWDVVAWKQQAVLQSYNGTVYGLAFSPDGKVLATGSISSGERVKLWDTGTGKLIDTLPDFTSGVGALTFSPDGKYLVMSDPYKKGNNITFWDRFQRQIVKKWTGHTGNVRCLMFSPDGRTLASGGYDDTVRLWEVVSGNVRAVLQNGTANDVLDLDLSPDGRLLATTAGTKVNLWNTARGELIGSLDESQRKIMDVSFNGDGKLLAAAGQDNTMNLWDVKTRQVLAKVTGHTNYVRCVAFRGDGHTFATGSYDKTIRLWSWRAFLKKE